MPDRCAKLAAAQRKFRSVVREDSKASIETEGMVGNKFVNIAIGSAGSPECPAGCTLPSQESVSTDAFTIAPTPSCRTSPEPARRPIP
jgi:ABC-type transporter Mla subunit MlaD